MDLYAHYTFFTCQEGTVSHDVNVGGITTAAETIYLRGYILQERPQAALIRVILQGMLARIDNPQFTIRVHAQVEIRTWYDESVISFNFGFPFKRVYIFTIG